MTPRPHLLIPGWIMDLMAGAEASILDYKVKTLRKTKQ